MAAQTDPNHDPMAEAIRVLANSSLENDRALLTVMTQLVAKVLDMEQRVDALERLVAQGGR